MKDSKALKIILGGLCIVVAAVPLFHSFWTRNFNPALTLSLVALAGTCLAHWWLVKGKYLYLTGNLLGQLVLFTGLWNHKMLMSAIGVVIIGMVTKSLVFPGKAHPPASNDMSCVG